MRWRPSKFAADSTDALSEVATIKLRLEEKYHLVGTEWRLALRWWLEQSRSGRLFEVFHSTLSLASCALYIAQTYEEERPTSVSSLFVLFEIIFICVFFLDYFLRVLAFGFPYAVSWNGLIDALTTVPTIVSIVSDILLDEAPAGQPAGTTFLFLRFFRFLRLTVRLLRALRFVRVLRTFRLMRVSLGNGGSKASDSNANANVQRQVMEIVLTALSIIFITASLLQLLEVDADGAPRFEWHESFYMTVVTISTVGYGDLSPVTVEGRMAVSFIIMLSLVILPNQTSKLVNMVSEPVVHGKLPQPDTRHIILAGNGALSHATVSQFLRALYALDSFALRSELPSVVLLHHAKIPHDIRLLLDDGRFLDHVSYVRGTPLVDANLLRARVSSAEAVLVLGDPGSDEFVKEDAASVMVCLAVRSYCQQVPMLVQLLSANSLGDLNRTLDPAWPRVQAVNVVELKNLVLAKAVTVPCFCAFITNLLVPPTARFESAADAAAAAADDALAADADLVTRDAATRAAMAAEYAAAASARLLIAAAPAALDGALFAEVALYARLRLSATLVGLKSGARAGGSRARGGSLALNLPTRHALREGDILYLICADNAAPARIMRLTADEWRAELAAALADSRTRAAAVWPHVPRLARPWSAAEAHSAWPPITAERVLTSAEPPSASTSASAAFSPLGWPFGGWPASAPARAPAAPAPLAARASSLSRLSTDAVDLDADSEVDEDAQYTSAPTQRARGARSADALHWRAEREQPAGVEPVEPSVCAGWAGHVVLSIAGGSLDWGGVAIFAAALRVAASATKLLVLTFDRPEPHEWAKLQRAAPLAVHWMRGSFTSKGHLARANLGAARTLVIIAPPVSQRSAVGAASALAAGSDRHWVDQQAVLAYLQLDAAFGTLANPAVLELEYLENVRFLRPGPHAHHALVARRPARAAAASSAAAAADADAAPRARLLLPSLLRGLRAAGAGLARAVVPPTSEYTTRAHTDSAYHPVFAAGRVFSMRALDALLNHAYLEPSIVGLVKRLALPCPEDTYAPPPPRRAASGASDAGGGGGAAAAPRKSFLTALPMPSHLVGREFGELFEAALTAHGVLCVALVSYGDEHRQLPTVLTCPPLARALKPHDLVYVITACPGEELAAPHAHALKVPGGAARSG